AELDIPTLHQFILDNPLGVLVTHLSNDGSSSTQAWPQLQSTHIPFILDKPDLMDSKPELLGVLRGHMARQSPHSKALIHNIARQTTGDTSEDLIPAQVAADQCILEQEVMILFNGPVAAYVTPSFYTQKKPETGKVVPTWNFSCVQAYGKLKLYSDSKSSASVDFIKQQATDLTKHGEETMMGFPKSQSWKISDSPPAFINQLVQNIIGVEITITRLEGKSKMMQEEKDPRDKLGVVRGFRAMDTAVGELMASGIERCMAKD
ncbi:transcriptional regulator, partial [Lophiotrema nucula]